MRRLVSCCLVLLMFSLSLLFPFPVSRALNGTAVRSVPVLRFDPATVVLGPDYCVGETFTLVARVEDVDDLYGMSLKVKWNTIYLDYVTHVAKVPVESFSDGLLHEQVVFVYDDVNTTTGLYALAVTSLSPAIGFTGSGIAFEITFRVKYQPLRPEQDVIFSGFFFGVINLVSSGCFIPHIIEDCEVTIASFLQADFNNDLIIDIYDIVIGVDAYGSTPIDPNWNDDCDLAEPYGIIDILDIVTIASHFGEEYIP